MGVSLLQLYFGFLSCAGPTSTLSVGNGTYMHIMINGTRYDIIHILASRLANKRDIINYTQYLKNGHCYYYNRAKNCCMHM